MTGRTDENCGGGYRSLAESVSTRKPRQQTNLAMTPFSQAAGHVEHRAIFRLNDGWRAGVSQPIQPDLTLRLSAYRFMDRADSVHELSAGLGQDSEIVLCFR